MGERQGEVLAKVRESLLGFDVEGIREYALRAVDMGVSTEKIMGAITEGMGVIGQRYKASECFVTDLIIARETMRGALDALRPHMQGEAGVTQGRVVVATVAGDIHDIGKDIFVTLMTIAGFEVIDMGVDVPAESIAKAVMDSDAKILGLSALLTTNLEQFPIVVDHLKKAGVRDRVKVIVGGATVTEEYAREAGVDAYAKTALDGVDICKGWVDEAS